MVVFDTSMVVLFIDEKSKAPIDPTTGKPVTECRERIEELIKTLGKSRTRILIPTPVLSEFLVKSGPNKDKYLTEFLSTNNFLVAPFDLRAAVELALIEDGDTKSGRKIDPAQTKAKVKFDRQIISIAKVQGATTIYCDDVGLANVARQNGLQVVMTWEIPLPKGDLPLDFGTDEDG